MFGTGVYGGVESLLRERGLVRAGDLRRAGLDALTIADLRSHGTIVLQPPGVYASPVALYPPEICAAVKWPNAVLMGPSALAARQRWRELEVPWLAIAPRARRPRSLSRVEFIRTRGLPSDRDVELVTYGGARVRAFSVERALLDCLRLRERFALEDLAPALRKALAEGVASTASLERRAKEKMCWRDVRIAFDLLLEGPLPAAPPWTSLRSIVQMDRSLGPRILVERRPLGSTWDASTMRGLHHRGKMAISVPVGDALRAIDWWEAPAYPEVGGTTRRARSEDRSAIAARPQPGASAPGIHRTGSAIPGRRPTGGPAPAPGPAGPFRVPSWRLEEVLVDPEGSR